MPGSISDADPLAARWSFGQDTLTNHKLGICRSVLLRTTVPRLLDMALQRAGALLATRATHSTRPSLIMLSSTCLRSARGLARLAPRSFITTARQLDTKSVAPTPSTESPVPKTESQLPAELPQAPNRKGIWSRSQRPRQEAMTGPRFEQTDFDLQVRNAA